MNWYQHVNWPLVVVIVLMIIAVALWLFWPGDCDEWEKPKKKYQPQKPQVLGDNGYRQTRTMVSSMSKQMKFKVGDIVRFKEMTSRIPDSFYSDSPIPSYLIIHGTKSLGDEYEKSHAKVIGVYAPYYLLQWTSYDNRVVQLGFQEDVLESVDKLNNNKLTMGKRISNAFKRFLNADLQTQVKAGYRNGELELTEEGRMVAIEALLEATPEAQKALTTSAQEVVVENEKSKG